MNRVRGRNTDFRLKQSVAMQCTFGDFMPGTDNDPDPTRTFGEYLGQFRSNAHGALSVLYGAGFAFSGSALAKVEGDVFELMEAGAIWNAFAAWNKFMDGLPWPSKVFTTPNGTVATPSRKAAILKLPRGYDTTRLFKSEVRTRIQAHEQALKLRGMELGLSSPDIVGIRIPDPMPPEFAPFLDPLPNLGEQARLILEKTHEKLEGTLEGRSFLFAIAVKRTTRSDRLYQPLFEANVLKYLIEEVLRGAAFRFHVHMGSFEGADVEGHYNAASLVSLMRGGEPTKAVTSTYLAERPVECAQTILNDLPLFPL
ncbi:MAG: Cfr10I/Bse634I family restriction endonuclease [Rhizobiales bacterium]|nr:Cfr10I/Bse634I family restriction endonuclease [Hyphomicrobiales bacterium]